MMESRVRCKSNMMDRYLETVRAISESSLYFYNQNRCRVVAILLGGSMGRGEIARNDRQIDADIILITRLSFDILVGNRFRRFLQSIIPNVEIDVGVLPNSRLGHDRSHYMYDLKYNSKVLAGADVRPLIPDIGIADLYPWEGFILILNRVIDLIKSLEDPTSKVQPSNLQLFNTSTSRVRRAYIDSYLIFNKQFNPDYNTRTKMFYSLGGQISEVKTFTDLRTLLINALDRGLEAVGIESYGSLLKLMALEYRYPIHFRMYALVKTRKVRCIFFNPIYDVYKKLLRFLLYNKFDGHDWEYFQRDIIQTFNNSPKLCLKRGI